MTGELLLIPLILWLILILVTAVFEENYSKRMPLDKLRFPRVLSVIGIGIPFPCGWLIYEMLHAEDWEEAKLIYILFCIPFLALGAMLGVCLLLLSLNWGIDIKEDRIVYRNVFRRIRTIYFTEITMIQHRDPRHPIRKKSRFDRPLSKIGTNRRIAAQKSMGSYRIYVGKASFKVYALAYHYTGSAARILKAMKKQGIQCPVTTKKTLFG